MTHPTSFARRAVLAAGAALGRAGGRPEYLIDEGICPRNHDPLFSYNIKAD